MLQSGVTELIWHFAGYLHLIDESARARVQYEDMNSRLQTLDFDPGQPLEPNDVPQPDELGSGRTKMDWPRFEPPVSAGYSTGLPHHSDQFPSVSYDFAQVLGTPQSIYSAGYGLRSGSITHVINYIQQEPDTSLQRQEGGAETVVNIEQYNLLNDTDHFGVKAGVELEDVSGVNVAAEIGSMRVLADDAMPQDQFPVSGGNNVAVGANIADTQISSALSGEAPSSVEFGVFVNGVLQDDETQGPDEPAGEADPEGLLPPIPEQPDGWHWGDPGLQGAELGSNTAENAAVIIDADEACGTLVVLGNYYQTNSVAQVNVYSDSDFVRFAGSGTGVEAAIVLDGNNATNEAELTKEPLLDAAYDFRGYTGYHWNIDISYGDYYDVKSLYQENVLCSNDLVSQTQTDAYYRVMTGANGQVNAALVEDYGNDYDLIVVLGNYHSGNFIQQTNILFDDDWIAMASDGEGGAQSIYGGGNELSNHASISSYGLDGFASLSQDFEAFIRGIETADAIAPEEWWSYSGSGSTEMNVLFVTGNYFDVNYIHQFNLISDADAAMQMGGNGSEQFISTGGNAATNSAAIIDVSAYGDQYLGGEAYEDWTLVQTNIIAGEDDEIVHGDADQLASEIVAFTYMGEGDDDLTDAGTLPYPPAGGGDELGHMMS